MFRPFWPVRLTTAQKEANKPISRERTANEHGFADLKNWRILTTVRMNARHATTLLRTLLVPGMSTSATTRCRHRSAASIEAS